ncbi:MAG: hypothetical protein US58_C0011G0010 [Candidatus Magasanikbacteria bacterium GW2011_GWA2_37_8]|uniref:Glycoside hydrolase family 42 N-terminal domain-containing protein n=1 Tax=Candidatus Magasanikbacteria bacterium GW2011_GWA2_37_8 TaxID=1619036 RepID=A0A0G0HCG7_9BACT|nr:MAG: hypothetical protein US58_C0011G0010 [Candidatus Magasanikbacteria bacterium GW2011_GWA2_37_8]
MLRRQKILFIFLTPIILVLIFGGVLLIIDKYTEKQKMVFGVSFNSEFATYLGFDPKQVFAWLLDDAKFKHVRLSAQWNEIEYTPGHYDFTVLDELMAEAQKRDVKVLLAVGQKTPRWPECHTPDWARQLSDKNYWLGLENYITAVAARYQNHPALESWQVENEPFLPFGENCRSNSYKQLEKEIDLVRAQDAIHLIVVTDSGELSTWRKTAQVGDLFGTTMYRVVWNRYTGYSSWEFFPATMYRLRLWVNQRLPSEAYIIELQAEPWIPDLDIKGVSLEEQYKSMNLKQLQKNIDYSSRTGMTRAYLWGGEWWYWLKSRGINEIPDFIVKLPKD